MAQQLLVRTTTLIKEALALLDETAQGVLLLVNPEQRLLRTVTDGDIRRLLLGGADLESPLSLLPPKDPVTEKEGVNGSDALVIMDKFGISQLPLVDQAGIPKSVLQRRDLDGLILLSTPHIGKLEQGFVDQAFDTNWIAPLGPNVDAFEKEFAERVDIAHAAALSSGTAGIHLALDILGVKMGDIVFCSSLTFVASANPILYQGAHPVFIDSEPTSWNMSPEALKAAFEDAERSGKMPKAVIVVCLYGQSADMDAIIGQCRARNVPIIEDAAESLGATYRKRASGTFGDLGVYSFNGNKIITTSGGGMLVSQDEALIQQARFLATQAREAAPYYEHRRLGYNYRMSNVLAGIGRGQLRILDDRVKARRRIFNRYVSGLKGLPGVTWMPEPEISKSTRWLTVLLLDPSVAKLRPEELITKLAKGNIEARRAWKPMHKQPIFKDCPYFVHRKNASIADEIFHRGVCLPSGSNLTKHQQDRVINAICRLLR